MNVATLQSIIRSIIGTPCNRPKVRLSISPELSTPFAGGKTQSGGCSRETAAGKPRSFAHCDSIATIPIGATGGFHDLTRFHQR